MAYVTGAQILAFVGKSLPTSDDTTWADSIAKAIDAAIDTRLNGAVIDNPSPAYDELSAAAMIAGAEGFKRREATFGLTGYADIEGSAIRVARDYLAGVSPLIDRHSNGPGIG